MIRGLLCFIAASAIAFGIGVTALGSVFGSRTPAEWELVKVVVAVQAISTGVPVEGEWLAELPLPRRFVHDGMVHSENAKRLVGHSLSSVLIEGQVVTWAHFERPTREEAIEACASAVVANRAQIPEAEREAAERSLALMVLDTSFISFHPPARPQ